MAVHVKVYVPVPPLLIDITPFELLVPTIASADISVWCVTYGCLKGEIDYHTTRDDKGDDAQEEEEEQNGAKHVGDSDNTAVVS